MKRDIYTSVIVHVEGHGKKGQQFKLNFVRKTIST